MVTVGIHTVARAIVAQHLQLAQRRRWFLARNTNAEISEKLTDVVSVYLCVVELQSKN